MSDHESANDDRLEAALRQLTPSVPAIDRDRLLYRAGQASGQRSLGSTALLTALAGAAIGILGTYLGLGAIKPESAPPRVVIVEVPVVTPAPVAPADSPKQPEDPATGVPSSPSRSLSAWDSLGFSTPGAGYLQQRDQALRWGVEALPAMPPNTANGPTPQPMNVLKMQTQWLDGAMD